MYTRNLVVLRVKKSKIGEERRGEERNKSFIFRIHDVQKGNCNLPVQVCIFINTICDLIIGLVDFIQWNMHVSNVNGYDITC